MKKLIISAFFLFGLAQPSKACAWSDPDYEYFNIFTQELINNPYYQPFLLTYSNAFYGYDYDGKSNIKILDENIESWESYFKNTLSYDETLALVNVIQLKHLKNLAQGKLSHQLFQKLGKDFYSQYKEGLDYLMKAKELEPFMRTKFSASPDNYYWSDNSKENTATDLNYTATIQSLVKGYTDAKSNDIKMRYAYQLVRLNHYTGNYKTALKAFITYVEPLGIKNHMYYYALDQKAGAQRGLKLYDDANWNFFQVFKNTKNKKVSAYNSMFFTKDKDFEKILAKAKSPEDKNMAYFLLAYNSYSNPTPIMQKMLANKADSDILKVLTARGINELERSYLVTNPYCFDNHCEKYRDKKLPFYYQSSYDDRSQNFIKEFEAVINTAKQQNPNDAFWQLADAYLKFLNGNYKESDLILNQIKTQDKNYLAQIEKFKMLNDIVSQPKITSEFEEKLMSKYSSVFNTTREKYDWQDRFSTNDFIMDVLANRYFIEKQNAKSFLMNNSISDLQYNPNSGLVKDVETFYKKTNKTSFEKFLMTKMESITDPESFFNVIYGDRAMRLAKFSDAKAYYEKAKNFRGIPRMDGSWDDKTNKYTEKPLTFGKGVYDGYKNISSLVFGHNIWESYESASDVSMKPESFTFDFIKPLMTKLELAEAMIQLEQVGKSNDDKARQANQLIGNLLYNTSILGYYREVFVMDVNNENGQKFQFTDPSSSPFYFYYKDFTNTSFVEPDNFDLSINFYKKALQLSKNKEDQAKILFQMASAEQGKYYQWENTKPNLLNWNDPNYETKSKTQEALFTKTKNQNYRTYFAELKKSYGQTKTFKDLQGSCLYFGYYTSK